MSQKFVALFKRKGFIKTIESYTDDKILKKIGSDFFGRQRFKVYDTLFFCYNVSYNNGCLLVNVEGFFVDLYIDIPSDVEYRLISIFRKKNEIEYEKRQARKRKYL